ncbi:hypothetical protein BD779DRAFT_1567057 [Infundibulicybe gibba]|nr:hypothetical protein BD779DRAFT_1567057 [Infundibulicybe gibba]
MGLDKQHFTGQRDGTRREHGYHPYSRPDQGHSYSYARSGGMEGHDHTERGMHHQLTWNRNQGLPPTEEPTPRHKSGRAQQPFYEPTSGYPFPNVPGLSSHGGRGVDTGSTQYAAQPQVHEGAGTNSPFYGLNSRREYPPSPSPSPEPPRARYALTPRMSTNGGRRTIPGDAARRNTRDFSATAIPDTRRIYHMLDVVQPRDYRAFYCVSIHFNQLGFRMKEVWWATKGE